MENSPIPPKESWKLPLPSDMASKLQQAYFRTKENMKSSPSAYVLRELCVQASQNMADENKDVSAL